MSTLDKLWKGLSDTIKLNDKVDRMADVMAGQQRRIESLTERVIRLEAQHETVMRLASIPRLPKSR